MSGIYRRAVGLLARREHTRLELERKMGRVAGATPEKIAQALDRLEAENLLSEERFAEEFTRSRMNGWGRRKLERELQRRGVSRQLAQSTLEQMLTVDERGRALGVLRLRHRGGGGLDSAMRAKLMRFLLSRGFDAHVAKAALQDICAGDDEA